VGTIPPPLSPGGSNNKLTVDMFVTVLGSQSELCWFARFSRMKLF